MRPANSLISILAFSLLCISCGDRIGDSRFISRNMLDADDDGRYRFSVGLSEGVTYSTSIAMRLDPRAVVGKSIEVEVYAISPDGERTAERIDLPLSSSDSRVNVRHYDGTVLDYEWPYRDNINVSGNDAGLWTIRLSFPDSSLFEAVSGVGFAYGNQYGKR